MLHVQFAGMLITMALALALLPIVVAFDLCSMSDCVSPTADIDNLKKFWESTNGPDWPIPSLGGGNIHWNFTKNSTGHYLNQPCHMDINPLPYGIPEINKWVGITCSCTSKTICQISKLILTSTKFGHLSGTIPSELTQLITLTDITLTNGGLSGSIPRDILAMPKLSQLNLKGNHLRGYIPNTTYVPRSTYPYFSQLNLDENLLTGTIPESLATFTEMLILSMTHNSLTGTIPEALRKLTLLSELHLNDNSLEGQMPSSLCSSFPTLGFDLNLQNNKLTGSIPVSCGLTDTISSLDFSGNLLNGPIPNTLGAATTLHTVHLENNMLTGEIPRTLLSVANLYLSANLLSGPLPDPLCSDTTSTLHLDGNRFTGSVPDFSTCLSLQNLQLDGGLLTGTLPEIVLPRSMLVLNISNSHISGSIPESFFMGKAVNSLQAIFLYNNDLTGSILPSLGNLKYLTDLNLGNNSLTGTIPVALQCIGNDSVGGFKSLDLSNNQLVGTIPTELSNWGGLQTMLLKNNKLENAGLFDFLVSPTLGQPWFPELQTLDISSNMFTGTLPDAVFNDFSNSLTMFAASQNCFHGTIPASICNATKLQTLSLTALNSGEGCRSYISLFSWKFPGFLAEETISGSVPECLFTLPDLKELLMTFLNLEGVLPETISPSMESFALEGNRFQGTISRELATGPKLKSLVLSHNYISGTLDAFNTGRVYPLDSFNLQLDVNAISGTIPTSLLSLESVNILYGNVFSCADGTKSLPAHDKTTDSYYCGSAGIDQILYVLGSLAAVASLVYLLLRNRIRFKNYKREIFLWLEVVEQRKLIDSNIRTPHIIEYQNYLFGVIFFASKVCLFICGLGILYLVLGQRRYRIVDHAYSWAVSSAYLYGSTPTFCCLIGWTGLMTLVCLFTIQEFSRTKTKPNRHNYARGFVSPLNDQEIKKTRTLRTLYTTFLCALRLGIFFLIVVGVIVAMNALYLYVNRVSSSSVQNLFKIGFAVFKLVWSSVVTQYLYHTSHLYFGIEEKVHDEFVADVFHSKTSVLLLASNLVQFMVPFAVTIILSPACLQLLFDPNPPEKYSYSYVQSIFPFGSAVETVNAETSGPFVYSSNCFSTILITYIPLYGAMFMMSLAKSATQFFFLLWSIAYKNDPTAAQRVWYSGLLSAIQYTLPLKNLYLNSKERKKIFVSGTIWKGKDKAWALRSLVHHMDRLLLLVTYGALCPPLGLLILASMIADSYIEKLLMGRFVTREMTAVHEFWNRQELTFAKERQETDLRGVGDSFCESFGIRISSLYCEVGSVAGTSDTDTNANSSLSTFHSSASRGSTHGSETRRSGSQRFTSFSAGSIGTASRVSGASVISVGAQRASSSGSGIGLVYDSGKMRASDSRAPPPDVASTAPEPRAASSPTLDRHHHASYCDSQAQHRSIESDIQEAAQPWGALAALTEVDRQCGLLPVALLKLSNGTFANAQALLFCFALYDIQNGGGVDKEVSWAAWVMFGIFVCLRLWMILYGLLCEGGRGEETEDAKTDIKELELGRVESIENPMYVIEKGSRKSVGTPNAEAPVSSSFPDRGSIELTLDDRSKETEM